MCGIAGIIHSSEGGNCARSRIQKMTAALRHRGPDEAGIYLDDGVSLGHARLSIIDLSTGTQPIHNEDETLWIVFNGEIFNHPDLRAELLAKGHRFYTHTDTETLLHLYEEKGAACLQDLNGQFAFAIWNTVDRSCFLARDRVGIRPLYYTSCLRELIFASEIKSILTQQAVPREIDLLAMDQIFTFWAPLAGRTPFHAIHSLPAGHHLTVRNGTARLMRYWQPSFAPRAEQLDWAPDLICTQIQTLLKEAIRIRLRADVPVGTYLSGGLDSAGITALVAQNYNRNVRSFGLTFEEDDYDEGVFQREMVAFLGVQHTEFPVKNAQIGAALPEAIWHAEKPLLRTAPVPLYLLSKAVHAHPLKVVLTGEGSDEVFGGYNIFREAAVRRFWARFPQSQARADLISHLYPYIFKEPAMKPMVQAFFSRNLDQTDDPLFSHRLRWENTARIKTFFSDDLKEAIGSYSGVEDVRERLPVEFCTWDSLAQAQYLEMTLFMSNYLLSSQGDRMAAGHSVEIRMPYLDPQVMDFMGRVPAVWKVLGLKEKYILKKSFQGILPDSIVRRSKHPYRSPGSSHLLRMGPQDSLRDRLSASALRNTGLFDPAKVNRLIRKVEMGSRIGETDEMALTGILTTQMFCDRFFENFSAGALDRALPELIVDRRSSVH